MFCSLYWFYEGVEFSCTMAGWICPKIQQENIIDGKLFFFFFIRNFMVLVCFLNNYHFTPSQSTIISSAFSGTCSAFRARKALGKSDILDSLCGKYKGS